jgi:hypothetical protein
MNCEFETKAWVDGKLVNVIASYEMDGIKPLVYGVFDADDNDVTEKIHVDEFDRIYWAIHTDVVGTMNDAADYAAER